MGKISSSIVGLSLLLQFLPVVVYGVEVNVKEQPSKLKQEVQQKREQLKKEMQEKRDALKKDLGVRRKNLAEETKEKREAVKIEVEKEREAFKQEAEKRKGALKKKLGEKRARHIEQFFANMVKKFETAIDRLKELAEKIEKRLDKAAAKGKDVVGLREKLAAARVKIDDSQKALEDAKAKYAEATKNSDFKVAFVKVREVVKGVNNTLKAAHRALVEVVAGLKGIGGGDTVTTTATTTP